MISPAVEMVEIVAGGGDQLRRKPNVIGYINVTTGLRHNSDSLRKLLFLAGKGLPTIYTPDVYSGVTGPITIPGSVALAIPGVLAGIVISQLKRVGAPIIIPGWRAAFTCLLDLLKVEILDIEVDSEGVALIMPGEGVLWEKVANTVIRLMPVISDHLKFGDLLVPVRPMIGIIGVAPSRAEGEFSTLIPWEHGGTLHEIY